MNLNDSAQDRDYWRVLMKGIEPSDLINHGVSWLDIILNAILNVLPIQMLLLIFEEKILPGPEYECTFTVLCVLVLYLLNYSGKCKIQLEILSCMIHFI